MEAAMLIGGEWRHAASSHELEVVNPATVDVVGSVPSGEVGPGMLAAGVPAVEKKPLSGSAQGWTQSAAGEYQHYRRRYLTASAIIEGS